MVSRLRVAPGSLRAREDAMASHKGHRIRADRGGHTSSRL